MPDLSSSGSSAFLEFGGPRKGRNYNYTEIYNKDNLGDEMKENARVWSVYLDEGENYDADMIQSFRNILDGLLIFASLFSAVVTTFVAQTSQALISDNTQIMASLMFENNQLLRAAGNITKVSEVPSAALKPGDSTYTRADVWVNGLFFPSLALSLSVALVTVMIKQWIQAYPTFVSGTAKDRALRRHFRFLGIEKWRVRSIIECLTLILHASVALFLIGLAIYVFQLSSSISWSVIFIAASTFLFYIVSSILPAIFIDCPYRVPFTLSLAQYVLAIFRWARCAFVEHFSKSTSTHSIRFVHGRSVNYSSNRIEWLSALGSKYRTAKESDAIYHNTSSFHKPNSLVNQTACDALYWVFNYSSNQFVKEIVVEAVVGMLHEWSMAQKHSPIPHATPSANNLDSHPLQHDLFPATVVFCLQMLSHAPSTITEDDPYPNPWSRLVSTITTVTGSSDGQLINSLGIHDQDLREQLQGELDAAYQASIAKNDRILSQYLVQWGCHASSSLADHTSRG
ncbi:hypothetical protein C0995_001182 [Termitomyces sp. Mi166|nr:hypothetical protein C0995_001182 [Termitomyces sp. Mi166\